MRFILIFLTLCICEEVFSQQFDSLTGTGDWARYNTPERVNQLHFDQLDEDSTMNFPHRIHPMRQIGLAWLDQGQPFSPAKDLVFNLPRTGAFQASEPLFANAFMHSDQILYYASKSPRTYLKYAQGTANLIDIKAEHNQNIFDRWSVGLNYHRLKTQNLYYDNMPAFNQQRMTNAYSAQLYSRYVSRDKSYEVFADYTWNKAIIQETGGVIDRATFDTISGRQKLYAGSAYLANAHNLFVDQSLNVTQFFRAKGRLISLNDTTKLLDTTYGQVNAQWFHKFSIRRLQNRFTDDEPNDLLYPVHLLSATTLDSMSQRLISNSFGRMGRLKIGNIGYKSDVMIEWIKLNQLQWYSGHYSNIQWRGSLSKQHKGKITNVDAEWALLGYYKGDWNVSVSQALSFNDSTFGVKLTAQSIRHRPDYNTQFFGANYHHWYQPFGKTDYQIFNAALRTPFGTEMSMAYQVIGGYVYVDYDGQPGQNENAFGYLKATLKGSHQLLNPLHIRYNLVYQSSSSQFLRLPEGVAKLSLYLEGKMFKKNMLAQGGVDGFVFSRFAGYQYDAASRMFRLSDDQVGGYPMIDIFLNMHVKTMKLFVVLEHAAQGSFKNDWYSLPGYPVLGRSIRFGAEWRLFN